MTQKYFTVLCATIIVLFPNFLFAADDSSKDEFSLEPEQTTEQPLDLPAENSSSESTIAEPSQVKTETKVTPSEDSNNYPEPTANTNLASPLEILQDENALYGFSIGLVYSMAPIKENYTVKSQQSSVDNDRQTENVSSAGFIFRYAVTPFYKIGTDMNVSYMKSLNHNNISYSDKRNLSEMRSLGEVTTVRAEFNLTYAVSIGKLLPIYFLGGIGIEQVTGFSVEEILHKNGTGGQIGGGFVISSTINIEGVASYYVHHVSEKLVAANAQGTGASTSTNVVYNTAQIINQGLVIRGSYSFK